MSETIRIIVVENNTTIAASLSHQLHQLGYDVIANVTTGEEALDVVKKHTPPDLVLMDIELGGLLDGIQTA